MAKRTHCPAGRPLYRYGDLPTGLATVTMLSKQRRRLADGQQPVASYWTGHQYVPLYDVAASTVLPPMTPRQQARWDAARTCARCRVLHLEPVPQRWRMQHGDRRLDDRCHKVERWAAQRPSQLALRMQATAWAREVTADPASVLLIANPLTYMGGPTELYAVDLHDGTVLVDLLVWPAWVRWHNPHEPHTPVLGPGFTRWPCPPGAVDSDHVIPLLTPLVGHRMIKQMVGRWNYDAVDPLHSLPGSGRFAGGDPLAGGAVISRRGDQVERQHRHWLCQQQNDGPGEHGLFWPELSTKHEDIRDVAARTLALLRTMAADDHPDGPAACPYLPPTGLEQCGRTDMHADGLCGRHSLTPEAVIG